MGGLLLGVWGECVGKLLRMSLLLWLIPSHHLRRHVHVSLVLVVIVVGLSRVYQCVGPLPIGLLVTLVLRVCVGLWLE